MWKQTTLFLLFSVLISLTYGELLCYSCQIDGNAPDKKCLNDPAAVSSNQATVKCKYKYCTIIRMEYLDPPDKIYSFYRGCAPREANNIVEGGGYKTFTRTCKSSLCNNWDGKDEKEGSNQFGGSGGSGGDSDNGANAAWDPGYHGVLAAPGKGPSGAVSLSPVFTIMVLVPLLAMKLVVY